MIYRTFFAFLFLSHFLIPGNMSAQNLIQNLSLMPYPEKISMGEEKFRIDENFKLSYSNLGDRIHKSSDRFLDRLAKRTGLFLAHPFAIPENKDGNSNCFFSAKQKSELDLQMNEKYYLKVSNNKIRLEAESDIGILRGIETLLQTLSADQDGYYFPELEIHDSPRFRWRGLMIDVSRHFMPVDVIKRNLDGMAAVKMNVLHMHLSDDQGFRLESKIYPKLHELASDGLYFTHEEIKDVIEYAADRGIRVIPEIDVPGHATAILTAFPELASAPGPYEIERQWEIFDPTLNPVKEETYTFLENLFKEIADLFPDEYFHIGGDENNGKHWDSNEEIQNFMSANDLQDNHAMQGYFNNRLLEILTNLDKKMIGWDEIFHPSMPKNIVIHSWRGTDALVDASKQGYQTILSNGYYIDLIQPTDFHYLNDPIPKNSKLTYLEQTKILGGEATMWAEFVDLENVDSRIWPRTAAIAERLWSPQNINDVEYMYNRLDRISYLLEEHGLTHIKNQEMMLRRLTDNQNIEPLKILVSVIEPVKIYTRNSLKRQTQQTPLTRVVDAAVPDAKAARLFNKAVHRYVNNPTDKSDLNFIKSRLELWEENHLHLLPVISNSPILLEIKELSQNLSQLSKLGLDLINLIENQSKPDAIWSAKAKQIIENVKKPVAQIDLMILPGIEKLYQTLN